MYEKEADSAANVKEYCYIAGGKGVTAVLINEDLYFLRRDVQGTITGLIDTNGNLAEEYSYDAWGRRRNPTNWAYDSVPQAQYLYRGYTMHEMLDEFGLINMNGRCYDPVVGRFLSPDIIVQNANITQCYNRYSYAVNNPLKYTDPSGWSYGTLAQMHNAEQRAAWQEMQARNRQLQHELQISNPKEARILSLGLHGKNGLGGTADGTFFSDIQSIVRVLQILGLPGVFGNPEEEGADYQSTTQETETIYVQNPGPYVIYFKPEQTMTINGVEYKDDGAYPLMPGQSWNYPVDGVKTQLHDDQVYKVPGKYGFYGDVTIDKEGNVDLDFYGLGPFLDIFYGWQDQLPAENWRNLWNSKPYKP